MSCASCHRPDGAFVDHVVHDVGTGGLFKTPTLLNANFNAPYFHDGRYDSYARGGRLFRPAFRPRPQRRANRPTWSPISMRSATAEQPVDPQYRAGRARRDRGFRQRARYRDCRTRQPQVIALTVDSVGREWRELGESFPAATDTSVHGGAAERRRARGAVSGIVLTLRRIAMAAESGDFAGAAQAYADYRNQAEGTGADPESWRKPGRCSIRRCGRHILPR